MNGKKKVVALGGDGIGPEVIDATCHILEKASFDLELIRPPCGEAALEKYNDAFPEETRQLCDTADAILFGATGRTSGAILSYIRWVLDNYIGLRPMKYYPGARSCLKNPSGIDLVIFRENSEGAYSFFEGELSQLSEKLPDFRNRIGKSLADFGKGKFSLRIVSEHGMQRLAKFVCEYTAERKKKGYPGKLTCVTKSNVLRETDRLFDDVIEEEVKKYPELSYEHYYADAMAQQLLRCPQEIDVIVTENMYGDILADEASELVGGLGLASSAGLGGKVAYFEAVHGSAPDIAGQGIANPTATILSAKLMLEHIGLKKEAESLERAVAAVYEKGASLTPDQGGRATTMECAQAVLREIR